MFNQKITLTLSLSFGMALCSTIQVGAAPQADSIRVVPCDKPVKSVKRGICLNQMDAKDFMALSPSVSWWYNWHYDDTQNPPKEANMEFLPMAWGDRPADLEGLKTYLAKAKTKPRRILTLNEPNLKGQAYITPEQTAQFYKKVKAVADTYDMPVVGPHMALGSSANDSIKAFDPIEKKEVTYTFMNPFLKATLNYMGDTEVPAVAAHSYGNFGELNWMTGMLNKEFNRPVWITEFAQWGAPNDEAERDYLIQSVDLFERSPFVEGYAWFKERVGGNPKISLLEKESGKLTPLGETYVNMPVHDPLVYYQLPGRLQSESYVTMSGPKIGATGDGEGFLEMQANGGDWLDYNVAVKKAGTFALKIRVSADEATKIEVFAGDTPLATATTKAKGWQTVDASAKLPAGNQTLRVKTSAASRLNWMEFSG